MVNALSPFQNEWGKCRITRVNEKCMFLQIFLLFWRNCTLGETWLRIDTILNVCGKIMKLSLGWTKMMRNNIYDVNDVSTEMYYHLMLVWPLKTMTIEKTSLKYCMRSLQTRMYGLHSSYCFMHTAYFVSVKFTLKEEKDRNSTQFFFVFFLFSQYAIQTPYCVCSFNTIKHNKHQTYLKFTRWKAADIRCLTI